MTAEGATFPGQDTPDTAAIRTQLVGAPHGALIRVDVLALCDALDAATARIGDLEMSVRVESAKRRAATARAEAAEAEVARLQDRHLSLLAQIKGLGYFGSLIAAFDLKERIERGVGKRARAWNASHPPPPGMQLGATWVAKRRQDIDE